MIRINQAIEEDFVIFNIYKDRGKELIGTGKLSKEFEHLKNIKFNLSHRAVSTIKT